MRVLSAVFKNTIREGIRKKFFIGLLPVCFLILSLSLLFAQLSLDDKGRLTVDFGLAGIQLLLVGLSLFFGAGFIGGDLDKKLWMVLVRPVHPSIFFLGRYLGLSFLLLLALTALSLLLITFFIILKIPVQLILFYTLAGFLFESLLILAFVFLFSSYVNPFLVLFYGLSVFMIGHFVDTLFYMIEKLDGFLSFILIQLMHFVPNLETVNWKSEVVYQDSISFMSFASSILYMFLWLGFMLSLSLLIMERREYS